MSWLLAGSMGKSWGVGVAISSAEFEIPLIVTTNAGPVACYLRATSRNQHLGNADPVDPRWKWRMLHLCRASNASTPLQGRATPISPSANEGNGRPGEHLHDSAGPADLPGRPVG